MLTLVLVLCETHMISLGYVWKPCLYLRLRFFFFLAFVRLAATVHVLCMNSSRKVWLFLPFQLNSAHRALFMNPQISLFNNFFIKNESYGTIYTFKNYFTTIFFNFSFQLYPNGPFVFFIKAVFVLGENHFRKCFSGNEAIWLVWKILFSGNWNPLTQKKSLWPRKCFYTSIFPSQHFQKMRERERARARARERRRSSPRSRAPAPVRRRDRRRDRDLGSWSRSCVVIVDDFFFWVVACVFWFVFSFFFSKHQKIFFGKFFEMQPNTEIFSFSGN